MRGSPWRRCCGGIDAAFERYEKRSDKVTEGEQPGVLRAGSVAAAEEMKRSRVGVAREEESQKEDSRVRYCGLPAKERRGFRNCSTSEGSGVSGSAICAGGGEGFGRASGRGGSESDGAIGGFGADD